MGFDKEEYWRNRNAKQRGQGGKFRIIAQARLEPKKVGAKAIRKGSKRFRKAMARQWLTQMVKSLGRTAIKEARDASTS